MLLPRLPNCGQELTIIRGLLEEGHGSCLQNEFVIFDGISSTEHDDRDCRNVRQPSLLFQEFEPLVPG
jgi:hypothetical protein